MHTITVDVTAPKDRRLKRMRVHDSRSRDYAAFAGASRPPTKSADHSRRLPIWDQGNLGSCTANAAYGILACDPLFADGWTVDEADCVQLYSLETRLDNSQVPGEFPPDDTGSSGLFSAKALRKLGLIRSWRTAFGLNATLNALVEGPVSLGVPWPDSFMEPAADGTLKMSQRRPGFSGGHQIAVCGIDTTRQLVKIANSWSDGWGDHGYGYLRWTDLSYLLDQGGDVTVFERS